MGEMRKNGEQEKNGEKPPKEFWIEGECLRRGMNRKTREEKEKEQNWWRKWRI
jgi:hypothetical protein|tara:strand:+ start:1182 stop:1340 length:159 start_codon:yes stop_codon:yes gene_type:complete